MSFGICPVPSCTNPLPDSRAYVCSKHYFDVDASLMRKALRMRFKCERARTEFQRNAMNDQVRNFQNIIIRDVKKASGRRLF
jgi:hypothetical protein